MQFHTLLLNQAMVPHRIEHWHLSVCRVIEQQVFVISETHNGQTFDVASPSRIVRIPSVAMLKSSVPANKKGVKFSRINVLTRDNFQCQYCGHRFPRRELNYDHVVPRRLGGKTVWDNIVTSCYGCNSRKAGRTPEQAGMKLLKKPLRPKSLPLTMPAVPIDKAPEEWADFLTHFPHMQLAFG
jgi:5-methylcytosine-specific restriction endonuclease McrA